MGDIGVHFGRAVFQQNFGGFAQCSCGIDHVIDDDTFFVRYIADHDHLGNFAGFLAAFVDDGQRGVDPFGQFARAGHTPNIG